MSRPNCSICNINCVGEHPLGASPVPANELSDSKHSSAELSTNMFRVPRSSFE